MKYIIKESQYKSLIKKKRNKKIANEILESVKRIKKNLNEGMQENAVASVLKKYNKKGLMNEEVKSILSTNNVNIDQ
jgi:hypothetical protein